MRYTPRTDAQPPGTGTMAEHRRDGHFWVPFCLLAIVAAALLLRVWGLDGESVYSDEYASTRHLGDPSLAQFLGNVRVSDPPMTPAFFTLEYYWAKLAGTDTRTLRLLPLFFGMLCVPLVFLLGSLVHNRTGGLAAAAFFSLSLGQIYYAQELRPYALLLALALISNIALWKATRHNGGRRWWWVNCAANMLLAWTHLFTVFFFLSQGVWLLMRAARLRSVKAPLLWGLAQAPNLMLVTAWISTIDRAKLDTAAEWRLEIVHSYLQPLGDLLLFSGAGVPLFRDVEIFGGMHMGGIMWRFFGGLLLLYPVLALWRVMSAPKEQRQRLRESVVFVLTLLVVPSLALFLTSSLVYACHSSRYVLYGSVAFSLAMGGVVALAPGRMTKCALAAVILLVQGLNLFAHPHPWRSDFNHCAALISSHPDSKASAVVYHAADIPPFQAAFKGALPFTAVSGTVKLEEIAATVGQTSTNNPAGCWLVVCTHQSQPETVTPVETELSQMGWRFEKTRMGWVNPVFVYHLSR